MIEVKIEHALLVFSHVRPRPADRLPPYHAANCWKYWLAAALDAEQFFDGICRQRIFDARFSFPMIASGGSRWFRISSVR